MTNERKTETITRELLAELHYYDSESITVEEQSSDFKNIKKLLSKASKSKSGKPGYPEFIVTDKSFPEYVVLVECKADLKNHKSKKLDDPKNFNLDGAIHYSNHLSEEFNVISIAITGTKKSNLEISIFIQRKGSDECNPLITSAGKEIKSVLSFQDFVIHGGYDSEEAASKVQDILSFSRALDKFLREDAKLTEAQKPLAICGILIALKDESFRSNLSKLKIKDIPDEWYSALQREINKANIPNLKKQNILTSFLLIKDHPPLIRKSRTYSNGAFFALISQIKQNVFPYLGVLKNYDILGKFFNEFLRYSGGDKQSFGIVLTPHHITEFCVELAGVEKDSKVLDTCCGTGGFLVSAMDKMLSLSDKSSDKEKILSKNIIGSEDLPEMFTLAAGNMILRGDGKSNIYQGDCFESKMKETLKSHKPNIGLINPPFSQKGDNLKELSYIINILDILEKGGRCVAILPLNCINTDTNLKREILNQHTLLASLSMPNQLFYPVGTVTSIVIFEAKKPHPKDFKTWLAYCKDDGFYNKPHRGRNDFDNKWDQISKDWLRLFLNREVRKDFSILKELSHKDEWCIENYMETDYSKITESDYENTVNDFIKFRIGS